jgi:hypothetical protein
LPEKNITDLKATFSETEKDIIIGLYRNRLFDAVRDTKLYEKYSGKTFSQVPLNERFDLLVEGLKTSNLDLNDLLETKKILVEAYKNRPISQDFNPETGMFEGFLDEEEKLSAIQDESEKIDLIEDFISYMDTVKPKASKPEATEPAPETTEETTSENLVVRKNLISTINPNVFVYNDLSGTEKTYKYIVENNPDITFVYQFSLGQMQKYDAMSPKDFTKTKLSGQVQLRKIANGSSVGIITGQNSVSDSFSKTSDEYYDALKQIIDQSLNEISDIVNDGGKVAFSINGYGDPTLMPEELFVYLSKRLFEEFQYLNPGSEFAKEVTREVAKYQPVTDAEILAKFAGENDLLKC